jgi:hypothetical protein
MMQRIYGKGSVNKTFFTWVKLLQGKKEDIIDDKRHNHVTASSTDPN